MTPTATPATTTPTTSRPAALGTRARSWLRRLDTYTLDVFNPGTPYGPRPDRG